MMAREKPPKRLRYVWDYPPGTVGQVIFHGQLMGCFGGPFLLVSTVGILGNLDSVNSVGWRWRYILPLILFGAVFLLFAALLSLPLLGFVNSIVRKRFDVAVRAYCRDTGPPHPQDSKHHYGRALARNFRRLDELAEAHAICPLVTFRFSEQPKKPELHCWYSSEEGLATVDALIELLSSTPGLLVEQDLVLADLSKMRGVLDHAAHRGTTFHLTLY